MNNRNIDTLKVMELWYKAFEADVESDEFKLFGFGEYFYEDTAYAMIEHKATKTKFKITIEQI